MSLSPRLFHLGGEVVALYATEQVPEAEVLAVAQEVCGEVEPVTNP